MRLPKVLVPVVVIGLTAFGMAGLAGAKTLTHKAPSKTATATAKLSVLPVGSCSSTTARDGDNPIWVPTELAAVLTPSAAKALQFYSVGSETLLGPKGWDCAQLFATDGSAGMAAYPPGTPNPEIGDSPAKAGAQLVQARFDYTDHGTGFDLACPYFPHAVFGTGTCSSTVPTGETVRQLTPDVVSITDPAGVKGVLASSGGPRAVTGLMILPQASQPSSGNIAEVSCSLKASTLCPSVLDDFVVRQFPQVTRPTS